MGAMMQNSGRDRRAMSDINVTPLVDVILVLLIIFMITAPMMQQGVEIDLPKVNSAKLQRQDDAFVVTVSKDGGIYINRNRYEIGDFERKIQAIFKNLASREVYVRADKSVPYGMVIRVIAGLKNAGIEQVGMVTEPAEESKP
jgi:biopolymer transport protein TolR